MFNVQQVVQTGRQELSRTNRKLRLKSIYDPTMPGYLYLLIDLRKILDPENNINVKNSSRVFKRSTFYYPAYHVI